MGEPSAEGEGGGAVAVTVAAGPPAGGGAEGGGAPVAGAVIGCTGAAVPAGALPRSMGAG